MAEGQGFEPWVPVKGTTVFETAPFNHSGIPPLFQINDLAGPPPVRKLDLPPIRHRVASRNMF